MEPHAPTTLQQPADNVISTPVQCPQTPALDYVEANLSARTISPVSLKDKVSLTLFLWTLSQHRHHTYGNNTGKLFYR